MLACSVMSSPASLRAAARCASARAASMRVAMSASLNCTAWKSSIGLPNCLRSAQYLSECSSALRAIATPCAPMPSRPASSPSIAYTNPMPSSPSMWAAGKRRSFNSIPAVFDARRPILSSGLAALYPLVSVGTMNVEMPLAPRRASGLSVRTMIIMRSAFPAFVAQALAPFSTQCFPSFVACDRSDAASEPASASESANPASNSPRAIGFSQRSRCSGVPCFTSIVVGIALWMPIDTASAASAAEISSSTIRYVTLSRPMPSYSSGVHMPRKPSLPSSSTTSRGKWLVRSHSAANGSIFSRANSRASSTTCSRTSVAVDIEPLARFPTQLSRCHHLFQQRRGPVFLLVEPILKHSHDGQTHIQTDQVRERERAKRMTHPQLHHLVHGLGGRDSVLHTKDGLVDHRHEHAVGYEARRIVDLDRSLAQLLRDGDGLRDGVFRRRFATNYLDERHHRNRVHEVHTDDAGRVIGVLGQLGDRDR